MSNHSHVRARRAERDFGRGGRSPGPDHLDGLLIPGTTYHYAVSALNAVGEGPLCADLKVTTKIAPPSSPLGMKAQAGPGRIDLDWVAPTSDSGSPITSYRVHRGSSPDDLSLLAETTDSYYVDESAILGQALCYRASAINDAGEGSASSVAFARLVAPPSAPIGLLAIKAKGNVQLNWSVPAQDGGDSNLTFVLYRGTESEPLIGLGGVGCQLQYLDSNLPKSGTLHYRVSAKNRLGRASSRMKSP
jgi:hypothetical protein